MIETDCPRCGERLPVLAGACPACGAANTSRRSALLLAAGLSVLGLALLAGLLVFLLSGGRRADVPGEQGVSTAGDNFAWLETAMKQCDEQAAKETNALHFLVTPLVDEPLDEAGWRRISLNDIGNAILLNGEDALAGLRRKALRLSTEEYTFSARDEATRNIFSWKPSVGVRKFVNEDASAIKQFRVQFQSPDVARGINWGATFERVAGNCYWVNAILRR